VCASKDYVPDYMIKRGTTYRLLGGHLEFLLSGRECKLHVFTLLLLYCPLEEPSQ